MFLTSPDDGITLLDVKGDCGVPILVLNHLLLHDSPAYWVDASGLLNHQDPLLPALLSIDLEQIRREVAETRGLDLTAFTAVPNE